MDIAHCEHAANVSSTLEGKSGVNTLLISNPSVDMAEKGFVWKKCEALDIRELGYMTDLALVLLYAVRNLPQANHKQAIPTLTHGFLNQTDLNQITEDIWQLKKQKDIKKGNRTPEISHPDMWPTRVNTGA